MQGRTDKYIQKCTRDIWQYKTTAEALVRIGKLFLKRI